MGQIPKPVGCTWSEGLKTLWQCSDFVLIIDIDSRQSREEHNRKEQILDSCHEQIIRTD